MLQHDFNYYPGKNIDVLQKVAKLLKENSREEQRKRIYEQSPYSASINNAFSTYDEFYYLTSLGLKEASVTRKALIKDIDLDMFISCEGKTNHELMLAGKSPYEYDKEGGQIYLHHIGQQYDGPFAELTHDEHLKHGVNSVLHTQDTDSWRNTENSEKSFYKERRKYWIARASGQYTVYDLPEKPKIPLKKQLNASTYVKQAIRDAVNFLFSKCSIDELNYFSNLAHGYALIKEIGTDSIDDFIFKIQDNGPLLQCPYCGSDDYVSNGFQKRKNDKIRRYKCKKCQKIFTAFNNSIISGTKLSFFELIKFIDCLYNGHSLEKTARLCNISTTAAFSIRMKLFYALRLLDDDTQLQGDIVIDETYILSSFKGNRLNSPGFTMTRKPHRRGHENKVPGTSKQYVCIVCTVDSSGNSTARIAGLGKPNAKKLESAILSAIDKKSVNCIYSDAESSIKLFATNNDFPIKQTAVNKIKTNYYGQKQIIYRKIQQVNAYHSRLKRFLRNFNGISSSLLSGYLYLFNWKDRNRNQEPVDAYIELLKILLKPNLYKSDLEIEAERIIPDPFEIEKQKAWHQPFKDMKRAEMIYERYAAGERQASIARDLGVKRQAISAFIKKFRELNMAYKTEKEISQKSKSFSHELLEDEKQMSRYKKIFDECHQLYLAKKDWIGTDEEFYEEYCAKTSLKKQTIKNKIVMAKRVLALRANICADDIYSYQTIEQKYDDIIKRYIGLKEQNPSFRKRDCAAILCDEFNYKEGIIYGIIQRFDRNEPLYKGKKTPVSESADRDKQIFVDILNWQGSKESFILFAQEKYGLSRREIYEILELICMADPKRYEIMKFD